MPRRTDLERILLIGSGPIVIGQGAEFDYSGTQAVKALKEEGYAVVLVNSNPATIMTDPELADRTYIEPVTPEWVRRVIERERPDALLPTMGGQTALNVAMALARDGTLARHGVELIGANARAIQMAEDRAEFAAAMCRIGLATPVGRVAATVADALAIVAETGYPAILRPSFTLGGTGGGVAYNRAEFEELVERALDLSPVHTTLIERSVLGWKEFELEVMRDHRDNVVIVCSIENLDPMGVHTGDSITVAPAMTLTDRAHRHQARRVLHPRRAAERHHEDHPRLVRAGARLRGGEGAPVRVRKVPHRGLPPHHPDEVRRRDDGDRPHLQGGVPEGPARARGGAAGLGRGPDAGGRSADERFPGRPAGGAPHRHPGAD